jgi:myo-inositol-1(or 4)-monophosphatase
MTDPNSPHYSEFQEVLRRPSDDLTFAINFAQTAGRYMVEARERALVSDKLDRTVVTDVDKAINRWLIEAVRARSDGRASVIGEEESARIEGSEEEWVIDPVDGTGEYVDQSLSDSERTSCVGIAKFERGRLQFSVVFNPFRDELFVADRGLGGAFLNGEPLNLRQTDAGIVPFAPGLPYDFSYWEGAAIDARSLEYVMDRPPIDSYSCIYQACMVAKGESAFSVFPGNTIHDIAPSALLVELSGGTVSGVDGQPLDWRNLNGAVFSVNQDVHDGVIAHLN